MGESKPRWAVCAESGEGKFSVQPCEDGWGFETKLEAINKALRYAEPVKDAAVRSVMTLKRQRDAEIRKAAKAEGRADA